MRLQLVVDQVVLGLALLPAVLAGEPLVAVGLRVHIKHMLAQVGGGGVDAAAQGTLRPVADGGGPAQSRPCNTEAAVSESRDHEARLSAMQEREGVGVAPPLLHAVDGVHVDLHVLARLEGLPAEHARVRQRARRVHVQDVLFEVAVVAVELAARGTGWLVVRRAAAAAAAALRHRRPGCSWGRRRTRSVLATTPRLCLDDTTLDPILIHITLLYVTSIVAFNNFETQYYNRIWDVNNLSKTMGN